MKTVNRIFFTVVLFFLLSGFSFGANVAKIGIIDTQKILTTSEAGKDATKKLNDLGKPMQEELKADAEALRTIQQALARELQILNPEEKMIRENEYKKKLTAFKTKENRLMQEVKKLQYKLMSGIDAEIMKIVTKIGKTEGYLMIVQKREGGILYSPDKIDITDRIIKKYNKVYAKSLKKAAKAN